DPRVSNVYRIQLKRRPPPFSDEFVFGKDAEDEDAEEEDEPSDDGEADNEDGEGEPEEADGNAGEGDGAEEGKKEEAEEEPEPVEIDFTDIDLRVEQVSGTAGNALGGDLSPDGKYLVYAADPMGHPALYAVRTADNKTTTLTEGGVGASNTGALPITFSPDGTAVYYLTEGGGIGVVKFSNGQNSGGGALQVRATKDIDTTAELRQMYREAWRSLRDGFYDPAMHGVDWDAVYEKYLPLATNAATREEFYTIVNLMLGELHASHLGIFGAGSFSGIPESGASLGVDFDEGYDGEGLKIASVVWRGPADQEESRLRPGEVILTVNGQPVDRHHTIWRPLENQAYRTVRLRVRGTDGAERDVKIWPIDLGTLNTLKYDQWVEGNRRKVEESSNGNVGYIHIRSMDAPSLQMFYRELYTRAADKDGLVIDVRFNGGGWIHEQLLDALNRDPIGKGQLRGDRMVTQPPRRFAGRMVLLINEYSYSDAEIFPMGFRNQQLGTIIGRPTGGAVIGTLNYPLIEGTQFRIPLMGWYDLDGRNMENWGVPPDIHITNDP
ncbi:MAG TPA: S41 family peptidase, partial [bacterium]|nr:S41 family peptidase [bacterium]